MDFSTERVVVTGGAGFLGKNLQAKLRQAGVRPDNLLVPTIEQYDLTREPDVERMYADMDPTIVIHLARPRSAGSAPIARTRAGFSTRTWPWDCTLSNMPGASG